MNNIELITVNEHAQLPQNLAKQLNKQLHIAQIKQFADGEIFVGLTDPMLWKNKKVIIIQSTCKPVHERILQISFLVHELKNTGANYIMAVIPYFGYARQEKSNIKGKSGSAQIIAKLLEGAGINKIIIAELHTPVIQEFFKIPTHNIILNNVIYQHIKENFDLSQPICLIAPDKGGKDRVKNIAQKLGVDFNVFQKERYAVNKTRITGKTSMCRARVAIIIDDIIDTGGTAIDACNELLKQGFKEVYGYFVHGVFSKNALEDIDQSMFVKLFVSNTIELPENKPQKKIEIFDISSVLVQAIKQHA